MRDIFELAPHVLPWAPTVPEPVMIHYLREAAITFCMRSRSWRSEETYVLASAGVDTPLVTCCDSVIFEIESVKHRQSAGESWSRKLEPRSYQEIDDWDGDGGTPEFFTQKTMNTIRVLPFYEGELRVSMYLKPDQQAQTLPDFIFESHPQIIAAGALAKILMLPKYDFADGNLAMLHASQFEQACDSHFKDNLRGQQRARTRTKASFL